MRFRHFNRFQCVSVLVGILWMTAPLAAAEGGPVFEIKGDTLRIQADKSAVEVSLRAPAFSIGETRTAADVTPANVQGEIAGGQPVEVSYPPIQVDSASTLEVKLLLQWSPAESVLRKWATVRVAKGPEDLLLKEVALDRIDLRDEAPWTHGTSVAGKGGLMLLDGPQSHPVFLPGRFLGIEYPVSSTRLEDRTITLAHRPCARLRSDAWYETRAAVYGLTPMGGELPAFHRYLEAHRPKPSGFHVNYNSWWTSPVPFTEQDILGLMGQFDERLFQTHGVPVDTFAIDMGWSNLKSIWEIDARQFPEGFSKIRQAAERMHARLGLWISPGSFYDGALNPEWAKENGFETMTIPCVWDKNAKLRVLCLGGKKYAERFKTQLAELVGRYGISHLKFDGCSLECQENDHDHEPGSYSSEAIAQGVIAAAEAARQANPEVWIETTCFGFNPSPWWLFHVNSVIGTFGDDAPVGRVPCPVYRESYTTARDYFNLQGTALMPIPAGSQEVLGIVHQSPDPMMNDAVVTVLRGHRFLPLYVNPKFMNPSRWKALADLLTWARNHAEILGRTTPLLPASWTMENIPHFTDQGVMPREPYGYAHVEDDRGLVLLRNPWIAPQSYRLVLEGTLGLSSNAADLSAVSLYPEPRLYGEGLKCGDVLEVTLAPYETVVLSIGPQAAQPAPPPIATLVGNPLKVTQCNHRLQRVTFEGPQEGIGPDWTSRLGVATDAVRLTLDANVRVDAPSAELLILCEGDKSPDVSIQSVQVDGRDAEYSTSSSAVGWSATVLPKHEHWTFVRVPLAKGENRIAVDQYLGSDCTTVSAWLWATRPGGAATLPDALPQPELISLGGAALIAPAKLADVPQAAAKIERPVDRIDGVFLDALEPASVSQGFGTLQKNQSVWEKPMTIGGKRYLRGLGTHAPSKITYALDGQHRRFQAWAGADGNTSPTVSFEVWLDGVKRWESGEMSRETPAARVDLDITGAKTLELRVGDCGNLACDHADWADAKLLH